MSTLLGIVITLVVLSWASARERGVPWMAWGTATKVQTAKRQAQHRRLRTRNIKPVSPWLNGQAKLPTAEAFTRLTELTRSEKVSNRLISNNLSRYPGRNRLWAAEKAIYDIERDRMAR
ncbi:MAG: hypothetical protein AAFN38_21750 [Cyanobacteria bacterium J06560_5]